MWGLMHLFFMTLIPQVECPHVSMVEPMVRYKIHDPYPVERPVIRHMHKRKGVQRVSHSTKHMVHSLIKMN